MQSVLSGLPGNESEGFWGLRWSIPPYSLCPLPATQSYAYAVLSCAHQQELQEECFSVLPYLTLPLFLKHNLFFLMAC